MRHTRGQGLGDISTGAALIVCALFAASSCKRVAAPAPGARGSQLVVAPTSVVVEAPDRIDADEILETPEAAFGLALPEGMAITKQLFDNVVVVGTMPMDDVVAYLKHHVDADVRTEPGLVTFTNVVVQKPRSPFRGTLRIEVARRGDTTVVELWGDAAPGPAPADSPDTPTARL